MEKVVASLIISQENAWQGEGGERKAPNFYHDRELPAQDLKKENKALKK